MIKIEEILKGAKLSDQDATIQGNLAILLERLNKVRTAWGKPMNITSGLRTMAHHIEIYKDLAKQRGKEFNMDQVPMKSRHLIGAAADVADDDARSLYAWCVANEALLAQIGLWMEEKDDQKRVHFQIVPPLSGKRFFKP